MPCSCCYTQKRILKKGRRPKIKIFKEKNGLYSAVIGCVMLSGYSLKKEIDRDARKERANQLVRSCGHVSYGLQE